MFTIVRIFTAPIGVTARCSRLATVLLVVTLAAVAVVEAVDLAAMWIVDVIPGDTGRTIVSTVAIALSLVAFEDRSRCH